MAKKVHKQRPRLVSGHAFMFASATGALGFGTLEGVLYVLSEMKSTKNVELWLLEAGLRVLLAIPFHTCTGALIGIGVYRQRVLRDPKLSVFKILRIPIFIHG